METKRGPKGGLVAPKTKTLTTRRLTSTRERTSAKNCNDQIERKNEDLAAEKPSGSRANGGSRII